MVTSEVYNNLKQHCKELEEALEICKSEKIETQSQFEKAIEDLQTQINTLTAQKMEKNEQISALQKGKQINYCV